MNQTSQGARWTAGLEQLRQDWRYALRIFRRHRLLSTVAVLSLGFGIGATTTVFSAVDAFHFRPLPFRNPDRLVWIAELTPHDFEGCPRCPFLTSPSTLRDWAHVQSFEAVAAIRSTQFRWQHGDVSESLNARQATPQFFDVRGGRPVVGRGFTPADAVPGAEPVALLSDQFWRTRLGADPGVLGSVLSTNTRDVRVVGILAEDFRFRENTPIWLPLTSDVKASRSSRSLTVIGRLRDDSTLSSATGELDALWSRLVSEYPADYRDWNVRVHPLRDLFTLGRGGNRFAVLTLTMLVLLIGVLNVSGLMLSRAVTRRQEFAIRSALGGTRARLVRQLLLEGTCIGLAGAVVGTALTFVMLPFVSLWFALDSSGLDVDLNYRVLVFAVALAALAGICTAIAPALHAQRAELGAALRERSSRTTARGAAARDVLAALQIALALMLLMTAALLSRDFLEVRYLDLGYDPKGLYFTSLTVPPQQSRNPDAWSEFATLARDRAAVVPGVISASLEHRSANRPKIVRPVDGNPPTSSYMPAVKAVDPAYFRTFGSRVLAGRSFVARDDRATAPVAIVNQAAASLFWPRGDAINRQIFVGDSATAGEFLTVVGIVEDAERGELIERHWPMVYRPFAQAPIYHAAGRLYVRAEDTRQEATLAAAQAAIRSTGRAVPPLESEEARVNEHFFQRQLNAIVFDLFAGFGLLLATMGIYASVAYGATRRTHEIGIRVALGATRGTIVGLLAGRQAAFALGGVVVGIVGVLALMRVFESFLLGISATNLRLLGAAGVLSICVALAATCIPAWRATGTNAADALRAD